MDNGRRQLLIAVAGSLGGLGGLGLFAAYSLGEDAGLGAPALLPTAAPVSGAPPLALSAPEPAVVADSDPDPALSDEPGPPAPAEPVQAELPAASHRAWSVIAPFKPGSSIGFGWAIQKLLGPVEGALVLKLAHVRGQAAEVRLYRNGGKHRGLAFTKYLDLVLMTSSPFRTPTDEDLGRAIWTLASNVKHGGTIHDLKNFRPREGILL